MKKILIFIIFFFFSFQVFADTYVLTEKDNNIIQNFELRVLRLMSENKSISFDKIITLLQNYNSKSKNIRITKVLDTIISDFTKKQNTVIILEWWNIYDSDNYLYSRSLIKKGEYVKYVENKDKIKDLSKFFVFLDNQNTLEWYLYPDTYSINSWNFKINEFVIQQLEAFEKKVYTKLFLDEDLNSKYTNKIIESVINLASMVEKEEKNPKEKATVAWILKKRLKEYWNIWADITVCYPYKLTSEDCKLVISKYINIKSDYNTRFIIWLPPSPIWNPSFETINATLNSKDSPYYYYLHDTKTWKVYYAETNEEHNKNKELYLK